MLKEINIIGLKLRLIGLCILISFLITLIFGFIFMFKKYIYASILFLIMKIFVVVLIRDIKKYAYERYIEKDSLFTGNLIILDKFLMIKIYNPTTKEFYIKRSLSALFLSRLNKYKVRYALFNNKIIVLNIEKQTI